MVPVGSAPATLVVLTLLLSAAPASADPPVLVPNQGPDVPAAGLPVATVHAIDSYLHTGDHEKRVTVDVPSVAWNRVFLTVRSWPNGDPWDRTLRVGLAGTELLRATTTRGDFTMREDVTEYASLLAGAQADVWTQLDSWVGGGIFVDVRLDFYDDPAAAAQKQPFDRIASPFRVRGIGGVSTHEATFDFGPAAPASGVVELITSGHTAQGEFWYQYVLSNPSFPRFRILVDGVPVGTVHAMPYVYALAGIGGGGIWPTVNQLLWTPAQTVQEAAGVHFVSGEVPSYRAAIPEDVLPLLSGARTVTIAKETHGGWWPTSLNFLLHEA